MMFINSGLLAVAALLSSVWAVPISTQELSDMAAQGYRLLDLSPDTEPVWKTEAEKLDLMRAGIHFFDVTEVYDPTEDNSHATLSALAEKATFPSPSHSSAVTPILNTLSTSNMNSWLSTLTAFNNRYYTSTTGKQASQWIYDTLASITASRSDITVSKFTHSWAQFSVIVHVAGKSSGALTVVGAHEDSINLNSPSSGRAPGADDDGTGTVNLIEVLRALIAAGWQPATPVEFHWYSGEEAGLLGSQAIAQSYKRAGTSVKAFMELDMTGYFQPGTKEVIALEADYEDSGVTKFIQQLVDTYSKLDWAMDEPCGYACSDHASWYKQGYATGMLYEAITGEDNQRIHGTGDLTSVSGFSWAHSLEFAKVALAFVYELSA
ncbi:Zn-dependent exopeptidase [Epithele typhae]|uniref:Zn-dependent exopeptidase n=1 Tax=Epithele typhae TaxID=378194 RepID=UPI002007872A|nr:Zn-dependent exopeptidase [Epithele typhae]KAH9937807.1 Zn-dependent exopeptidase [Epithele typhae]